MFWFTAVAVHYEYHTYTHTSSLPAQRIYLALAGRTRSSSGLIPMWRGGACSGGSAPGISWVILDLAGAQGGSWSGKPTGTSSRVSAELLPVCFLPVIGCENKKVREIRPGVG